MFQVNDLLKINSYTKTIKASFVSRKVGIKMRISFPLFGKAKGKERLLIEGKIWGEMAHSKTQILHFFLHLVLT